MKVMVVLMVESIRPEQRLSLVLSGKRLLDEENHLLYEEYQEEPATNDKFGDGKVDSDPVLCLNLLKYLNQTWLGLKYSFLIRPHLVKQFFCLWDKVQEASSYENSSREARTEADEDLPPPPGTLVRVVTKFGEGLKRENSTKEGYDCHRKDGDGLLLQQAFIARVHVDVGAHCQMQIYLESSCSVCHNVVRISRISVAMLSGHGGVK